MRLVLLGNYIKIVSGFAFKSELFNEEGNGLPLIRVRDVNSGFSGMYYSGKYPQESVIYNGDILIGMDGDFNVVFWKNGTALLNQRVCKITVDEEKLDKNYLFHFLPKALKNIHKKTTFTTVKHLSTKSIEKIQIPIPGNLDEQIRIAAVLTRAEQLIAKRQESIKVLDELLKSTFLEMFGPENKDFHQWPVVEIRDLAAVNKGSMRTGPFGSKLLHGEFTESGDVAVLGIDNAVQNKFVWDELRYITMEKYAELSSYRVFPGDVIITIMGTIGRSAVIPDDIPLAINTKHLAAITLDKQKANPRFISYSIHSSPYIIKQLARKNRGAIMNGLNLGLIKETKLRKPPIELQNQFAAIVEKVEALKAKYTQSLTDLENLYDSLSQRAFKGDLDLSKVPVVHEIIVNEDIKVEIGVDVELKTNLEFTVEDLVEIIKKHSRETFSFDELWEEIEKLRDKKIPSRNDIQKQIIELLESDKENFQQVFNILTSEVGNNGIEKRIAFRGSYEN